MDVLGRHRPTHVCRPWYLVFLDNLALSERREEGAEVGFESSFWCGSCEVYVISDL